MRAVQIRGGAEYRLEASGDTWAQGDTVKASAVTKGGDAPADLSLALAHGDAKKVKARTPGAYSVLRTFPADADVDVPLPLDCPVTDGSKGPYLLLRSGDDVICSLALPVTPHPHHALFVRALETHHGFVSKGHGWGQGTVRYKFTPPDAKRYTLVGDLTLRIGFDGDLFDGAVLVLAYSFAIKKLGAGAGTVTMSKQTYTATRRLKVDEYVRDGLPRHDVVDRSVDEVLDGVPAGL